jgi:transposase
MSSKVAARRAQPHTRDHRPYYREFGFSRQNNLTRAVGVRWCGLKGFFFRGKSASRLLLGGSLGVMERLVLSNAAWERMAPLVVRADQKVRPGATIGCRGRCAVDRAHRLSLARSFGGVWRLGQRVPTLHFSRWSVKGVWQRIFEADVGRSRLWCDHPLARRGLRTPDGMIGGSPFSPGSRGPVCESVSRDSNRLRCD